MRAHAFAPPRYQALRLGLAAFIALIVAGCGSATVTNAPTSGGTRQLPLEGPSGGIAAPTQIAGATDTFGAGASISAGSSSSGTTAVSGATSRPGSGTTTQPGATGTSSPGTGSGSGSVPPTATGSSGSTPPAGTATFPVSTATASTTPTAAPTPSPSPTPIGGKPQTVSIAAAGDIACDPASNTGQPNNCDQAATANLIGSLNPTAVLPLGDIQYENGALSSFQAVYGPTWGKYYSKTYPAIGNHEYLTAGAAGYFSYFKLPSYYAYNLGNWHLVSLNSECSQVGGCGPGSAQETWLRKNLAQYPAMCTLVYWHEPRWSSGEWQDATQMTTIWNDLVAAGVDVVLSGHNHDYERFVPLDQNGQPSPTGVMEFVIGTGGKNDTGWVTGPLPGEVVRDDTSFGVLSMTLGPTSFSWRYVPAPGFSYTDSGSASCH